MTNLVDRFYAAVSVLAGDGHIKQRLIRAYTDNLADIDDDELPVALQENFAETRKRMQRVAPVMGEGPIRASVRKMSAREASECALALFTLYSEILKYNGELPRASGKEASGLAPFLVKTVSG